MAAATNDLVSYDVFDTVLTRMVGLPVSAFLFVGHAAIQRQLWNDSAVAFQRARIDAEDRARRNHPDREVTLKEIYQELAHATSGIILNCDELIAVEIEVEQELLVPIPANLARIQQERSIKRRHAFISDMYLPADVIAKKLHQHGIATDADTVWVSSTTGRTKGAGSLFDLVREELKPTSWTHVGDNAWADVTMPRRKHIHGELFSDCHLSIGELELEKFSTTTHGASALFAGAARWTRINLATPSESSQQTLQALALNVAGPIIYAYVWWILHTCKAQGIRKIWFMARDGEVMLPVARSIATKLGLEFDLGYLYAGRQVIKPASVLQFDASTLEWIMHGAEFLTVNDWLTRLNIGFEEAKSIQPELPERTTVIGRTGLALIRRLTADVAFQNLAIQRSAEIRTGVLQYLQDCGLMGDTSCCIVDIGWRGTVLKALDELLGHTHTSRHLYLYFGLHGLPATLASLQARGFLFEKTPHQACGRGADLPCLTSVMEIFCQADHGPVLGLRKENSTVLPRCGAHITSQSWNISQFQEYIRRFADAVPLSLMGPLQPDMRPLVEHLLRRLLTTPTNAEATLIAAVPFTNGPEGGGHAGVCRAYGMADLPISFRKGRWPYYGLNWWTEGAKVMTPTAVRTLVRVFAKLGRICSGILKYPLKRLSG
jgi:FMN phosphatase YigB (HAD superfamily)